ncbi:hypothetical protein GGI05_004121 [Coemansia sp. RSA 2603]|nr:hypothetical protein GGI05_004121 [Coemansia sp. RSA 2603]
MTLLWQYFAGDETQPELSTEHTVADALSSSDTASSSWCSVQRPVVLKTNPSEPSLAAIPAHQRVACWLAQQQDFVHYGATQPTTWPAARGPPSDVSLGDFLRCSPPYRPSFMDRRSAPAQLAASGDPVAPQVGEQKQHTMLHTDRLEQPLQDHPATLAAAEPEGDADFLHHAFGHFVAFQPLDFQRHRSNALLASSGAMDEGNDGDSLCGETCVGQGSHTEQETKSLWAYFASVVDEMTRDVTFIH